MPKIISVTVTKDRLSELKKVIDSLRHSGRRPDEMIVVNNDSRDGTREWLAEQTDIVVINQGNTGSSGGEYSGMKLAMERGADFVWLVEDDIIPRRTAFRSSSPRPTRILWLCHCCTIRTDANIFIQQFRTI